MWYRLEWNEGLGSGTILHVAAKLGLTPNVKNLIRDGAEVDALDDSKRSPL